MFRQLVFLLVLAVSVLAAPIEDFPEEFKSLIPREISDHLENLTDEEEASLKELANEHVHFKNEAEVLAVMKEKSPSLHQKTVNLVTVIKSKVAALGDEAKTFTKNLLREARELHREYLLGNKLTHEKLIIEAKIHIAAFRRLSDEAKLQFEAQFPRLAHKLANI